MSPNAEFFRIMAAAAAAISRMPLAASSLKKALNVFLGMSDALTIAARPIVYMALHAGTGLRAIGLEPFAKLWQLRH